MKMTGIQRLQARGNKGMRNDTAMTAKSQHPENKDLSDVTPGPEWQQRGETNPVKIKLPDGIKPEVAGKKVTHLATGHHVKNADGSTSFHLHDLDGEPVGADDVEPPDDSMTSASANGGGMQGSPYGISQALRGLSM